MAAAMKPCLLVALSLVLGCAHPPSSGSDAGTIAANALDAGRDAHKLGTFYPDPILDIGGGQAQINQPTLTWPSATASPTLTQASTGAAAGANLAFCVPQASTATNGTPGNCVTSLPAPTGTGSFAGLVAQQAGTQFFKLGKGGPNSSYYSLWLGDTTGQGGAGTDWCLANAAGGPLLINAPGTQIQFSVGGGAQTLTLTANGEQFFGNGTASFGGGVAVIGIHNATTVPTTNPTAGGVLYATNASGNSELFWRDSAGVVTQITPGNAPTATTLTSSGTFTSTGAGLYLAEGCGGGGGGGGSSVTGTTASGGGGGGGAELMRIFLTLAASTGYSVTIGPGGTAGAAGNAGSDGTDTGIVVGSQFNFIGAQGGSPGHIPSDSDTLALGGASNRFTQNDSSLLAAPINSFAPHYRPAGYGGYTSTSVASASFPGSNSMQVFTGGIRGVQSGTLGGGGGGGAGPYGNGAAGGAGSGGTGSSAAANSCAGGGGGGAINASGGAGGSGQLTITGPL